MVQFETKSVENLIATASVRSLLILVVGCVAACRPWFDSPQSAPGCDAGNSPTTTLQVLAGDVWREIVENSTYFRLQDGLPVEKFGDLTLEEYQWAWDVSKVTVALLTVLGLPMWLVPDLVSSIFIHDPDTRELARWPMRLVGLTMPIEAMGFAFMHALLGAGDAKRVMMVGIGSQWLLFLPLAYLFGPVLGFGLFTIWLLNGAGRTISTLFFLTMWRGRHWQRIVV